MGWVWFDGGGTLETATEGVMHKRQMLYGRELPHAGYSRFEGTMFGPRRYPLGQDFLLGSVEQERCWGMHTFQVRSQGRFSSITRRTRVWRESYKVVGEFSVLEDALRRRQTLVVKDDEKFYIVFDKSGVPVWWERPPWEPSYFHRFEKHLPPTERA